MKRLRHTCLCWSALLLLIGCFGGRPRGAEEYARHPAFLSATARFEAQIAQDVAEDSIGGLTAGVVMADRVVWKKGFGWADASNRVPADGRTIYRIGSISKSFTAVLMVLLAREGVLRYDDPVERHLPEIRNLKDFPAGSQPITLKQLATHTSGLALEPTLANAAEGPIEGWEEKIIASIPTIPFVAKPGERYSYSNIGYGILGLAISRAAKRSFMDLVRELIIEPLGMKNTAFVVTPSMRTHVAVGYSNEGGGKVDPGKPAREHAGRGYKVPNGGIYSDIDDLALFLQAQTAGSSYRLLTEGERREMQRVQIAQNQLAGYGFGFSISTAENGVKMVGHGGSVAGYTAYLLFDPDSGIGVILLRNYNRGRTNLGQAAKSLLQELRASRPGP